VARRFTFNLVAFVFLIVLAVPFVWLAGSANPFTPAGYVGYLTKGAVFGKSRFYGTQRGPTSAGRTWLLDVTNVSVTPYTYSEDFRKRCSPQPRQPQDRVSRPHGVAGRRGARAAVHGSL